MLCMYVASSDISLSKVILGLGGKASTNKLKDSNFNFLMTNTTIFRMHAQVEYLKFLELKSTSIFNILALLLL